MESVAKQIARSRCLPARRRVGGERTVSGREEEKRIFTAVQKRSRRESAPAPNLPPSSPRKPRAVDPGGFSPKPCRRPRGGQGGLATPPARFGLELDCGNRPSYAPTQHGPKMGPTWAQANFDAENMAPT